MTRTKVVAVSVGVVTAVVLAMISNGLGLPPWIGATVGSVTGTLAWQWLDKPPDSPS